MRVLNSRFCETMERQSCTHDKTPNVSLVLRPASPVAVLVLFKQNYHFFPQRIIEINTALYLRYTTHLQALLYCIKNVVSRHDANCHSCFDSSTPLHAAVDHSVSMETYNHNLIDQSLPSLKIVEPRKSREPYFEIFSEQRCIRTMKRTKRLTAKRAETVAFSAVLSFVR